MGIHHTRALALLVSLIGVVLISTSLLLGGSIPLFLAGVGGLALAGSIFLRAKPWRLAGE